MSSDDVVRIGGVLVAWLSANNYKASDADVISLFLGVTSDWVVSALRLPLSSPTLRSRSPVPPKQIVSSSLEALHRVIECDPSAA